MENKENNINTHWLDDAYTDVAEDLNEGRLWPFLLTLGIALAIALGCWGWWRWTEPPTIKIQPPYVMVFVQIPRPEKPYANGDTVYFNSDRIHLRLNQGESK